MSADDIRRDIAASRSAIQSDYAALRAEFDFAAKTKRAVVEHPLRWLGGAAFLGFLLSGRRRQKPRKQKGGARVAEPAKRLTLIGAIVGAIRLLFPLARPILTAFATRQLASFAGRFQPSHADSAK
ncbi:MAG: hypothetical protein PHC88_02125 [Terrimicrobiaceae bacterium]|nr:hypothetical protein [Terrimicrobiaceae bacterium]